MSLCVQLALKRYLQEDAQSADRLCRLPSTRTCCCYWRPPVRCKLSIQKLHLVEIRALGLDTCFATWGGQTQSRQKAYGKDLVTCGAQPLSAASPPHRSAQCPHTFQKQQRLRGWVWSISHLKTRGYPKLAPTLMPSLSKALSYDKLRNNGALRRWTSISAPHEALILCPLSLRPTRIIGGCVCRLYIYIYML